MNVHFERTFSRDLRRIRDRQLLARVKDIIAEVQKAETTSDLRNLQKLQGYADFYRIRVGDYRIGLEIVEDDLFFIRFLHRREIYRRFP